MSSGQSLRNGSSVEPGLPKTFLMPNARRRAKVASLTVTVLFFDVAGWRDDIGRLPFLVSWRSVTARSKSDEANLPVDGLVREVKQRGHAFGVGRACLYADDRYR